MSPGENFLTVFVAFLAGATVYLGIKVRDLERLMTPQVSYIPLPTDDQLAAEREAAQRRGVELQAELAAHEAMKQRTAELQAEKLAERPASWPYEPAPDPAYFVE